MQSPPNSGVTRQLRSNYSTPEITDYNLDSWQRAKTQTRKPKTLGQSDKPPPPHGGKQLCLGKEKAAKYQTLEDTQSDDTPHKVFCAAIVVQIFQDFLTNVGKVVGVSEEGKSFQSDLFLTVKWGKFEPFFSRFS